MVNLLLSCFEVFNSNFNILNVLSPFSLKITIHNRKTLFKFIPKYPLIRNSSFHKNAKTKVYALEDSFGVHERKILQKKYQNARSFFLSPTSKVNQQKQ